MERRKFIIGMGSLAAGGAAAIGSGAFGQMSASRDADINVVNDASGLIALRAGANVDGGVVKENNGELEIDFTDDGNAGGVNVNSRYQIGTPAGAGNAATQAENAGFLDVPDTFQAPVDPAFTVTNQESNSHEITLEYEADASDVGGSELYLYFAPGTNSGGGPGKSVEKVSGTDTTLSYTSPTAPGDAISVVIFVDTRDGDTGDDLSGTLTVSAD